MVTSEDDRPGALSRSADMERRGWQVDVTACDGGGPLALLARSALTTAAVSEVDGAGLLIDPNSEDDIAFEDSVTDDRRMREGRCRCVDCVFFSLRWMNFLSFKMVVVEDARSFSTPAGRQGRETDAEAEVSASALCL
jgi:hypothetical protein